MDKKWEIRRVSTPERIFNKIREKMAQPVGIVLFGADCDLKDEVYMECVEQIPNLTTDYGGKTISIALRGLKQPLAEGRNVLLVLDGDSSGQHEARHQTVAVLQNLGAKTIVGIYVKFYPIWLGDRKISDEEPTNEQAWRLLNHPPTADGLDYFIVVEEEKEG